MSAICNSKVEGCVKETRAGILAYNAFVKEMITAPKDENGNPIKLGSENIGLSLINTKLKAFCDTDWDNKTLASIVRIAAQKAMGLLKGALAGRQVDGKNLYTLLANCFDVLALFKSWATQLFGNGPTGATMTLCNNIHGQDFFGNNCNIPGGHCINALSGWTWPSDCVKSLGYVPSKIAAGAENGNISPEHKKILSAVCDDLINIKLLIVTDEKLPCTGKITYGFGLYVDGRWKIDDRTDWVYDEIEEHDFVGQAQKDSILKKIKDKMIETYAAEVLKPFVELLDDEVRTAVKNSSKWVSNLNQGLTDVGGSIDKMNYTMSQYIVDVFQREADNHYKGGPNTPCGDLHKDQVGLNSKWWKEVDAANKCVDKLMKTPHPNCKVRCTEEFSDLDLQNPPINLPPLAPGAQIPIALAQQIINAGNSGQPGIQCSDVTIVEVRILPGNAFNPRRILITYEFSPSVIWDRQKNTVNVGPNETCNNGEIASFMADLVKVLNATRTPACAGSPLEYLAVDSQDLGRPIKRIGKPLGIECEYSWPNKTNSTNFGDNDGVPSTPNENGPIQNECAQMTMPTNCKQYPSIYNQEERFGFVELFFALSVALPYLKINNKSADAGTIYKQIRAVMQREYKKQIKDVFDKCMARQDG